MRRRDSRARGLATSVLVALVTGCATAPPAPPLPPRVTVTTPPAPAPAPAPPVSVGPRAETREEVVGAEAPAPAPVPAPAPPTAPPVPPSQRGRFIVLNFDNADIETVVHAASEILGFNYVLAPDVRGKVTVQTSGRIPQEDVFGVLLAILEVHGFTAVKAGNLYKIVKIEGARERAVPTIVGTEPDPARATDEVITQIVPIRYASVTELSALLRPLMSARGNLIAHRETNVLIITDVGSNVNRLLDIIRLVDVSVTLDELQVIPIQYADAAELAQILTQMFQSGRVRAAVPGAPAVPGVPAPLPAPAAPGVPAPAVVAPAGPGAAPGERPPLILAERRSNRLIVYARKNELELIKKFIAQIDVSIIGGRRVFIYYAENAKAKDLAATLNEIYGARTTGAPAAAQAGAAPSRGPAQPGQPAAPAPTPPGTAAPGGAVPPGVAEAGVVEGQLRFIPDEVTNAVIVITIPRLWSEIEATIKQLDKMPRQVLIEVLVAEITLTDDLRLGIDWAIREGKFRAAQQAITPTGAAGTPPITFPAVSAVQRAITVAGLPGAGLTAFSFASNEFFAILNTLAADNKVNIVSNPHILTSENKKAVINVSTSVPIITAQQTSTISQPGTTAGTTSTTITTGGVNQTVEYRDAGVILTVTPRIGERGTVALDVKQEVNDVGPAVAPTNSPSFIKREAETSVVLLNNQTLVLGGLIRDRTTLDTRGIPFLKDIPILGLLFGFKERRVEKTELLLLITPRVVGTALDAARVTEEMRRATPELEGAIRRAPRPPTTAPPQPPAPAEPAPAPGAPAPAPGPPASAPSAPSE